MSNILVKDRKPVANKLKAAALAEEICFDIYTLIDKSNIKNQIKYQIVPRMLNLAFCVYENVRAANDTHLEVNPKLRLSYESQALYDAHKLSTDMTVLRRAGIIKLKNGKTADSLNFLDPLEQKIVKEVNLIRSWLESDKKRVGEIKKEKERKQLEERQRESKKNQAVMVDLIIAHNIAVQEKYANCSYTKDSKEVRNPIVDRTPNMQYTSKEYKEYVSSMGDTLIYHLPYSSSK